MDIFTACAEQPVWFCISFCHLWQLCSPLAVLHCGATNADAMSHFGFRYRGQFHCSLRCATFFLYANTAPPPLLLLLLLVLQLLSPLAWLQVTNADMSLLLPLGWLLVDTISLSGWVTGLLLSIVLLAPHHLSLQLSRHWVTATVMSWTVVVTCSRIIAIASSFLHCRSM